MFFKHIELYSKEKEMLYILRKPYLFKNTSLLLQIGLLKVILTIEKTGI